MEFTVIKMEGLGELSKALDHIQKAMAELNGDIGQISFNPNDPESINIAIASMEKMIDNRLSHYSRNDVVAGLIEEIKDSFRSEIIKKAAEARLGAEND